MSDVHVFSKKNNDKKFKNKKVTASAANFPDMFKIEQ